jgi:hypothetical protein
MKRHVQFGMSALCCAAAIVSTVNAQEITTSAVPTEYCIPQTFVRGDHDALVIDHNLIIPAEDQFRKADIYVGARFKSRPGELWLLSGIRWRRIETEADLHNAAANAFEELPLVVPVTVFYKPTDVSAAIGDGQIWVGYGFRSVTQQSEASFAEMQASKRYRLLWESPEPPYTPALGLRDPYARLCIETSKVARRVLVSSVTAQDAPPVPAAE